MRHHSALGGRMGTERFGVPTHPTSAKIRSPGGVLGSFGGNPTKTGSFSSAAKFHYFLLWWGIEATPILGIFGAFLACSARFDKNGDFLAAQPTKNARLTAQCDGT